jgi:lipopolysaccharide assembly outer membrane protein LptD (OstA)
LINRGSTYVYGDRADYNGDTNEAKVYSKIVKVVDGDATLFTYNFSFNTQTNIGYYSGGGVLISGENMLESDRGYLYSDSHEIICVERVQMRNNDYEMKGDSVVYNTETNFAQFFTRTNIWNKNKEGEDDYLYTDRGSYDKATQLYKLTKHGYILTADQELFCDSLDYYRDSNYVVLKRNIQIDDRSQKLLIFGDWGEYWKEPGNVFITRNPSLISYDTTQSDSVFISSDSMWVYMHYPIREKIEKMRKDSLEQAAKLATADSLKGAKSIATDSLMIPIKE